MPVFLRHIKERSATHNNKQDKVQLKKAGIRAQADLRDSYTPGYKFNDWEQKVDPASCCVDNPLTR